MHLTHNEVYKGSIPLGLNKYTITITLTIIIKVYYIIKVIPFIKVL